MPEHIAFAHEFWALAKSAVRVLQFVGLVIGLGAATLVDLLIMRFFILGEIKQDHVAVVEFGSKVVTFGLLLLWLSGITFLFQYQAFDPSKLGNPKIWAKIAIVVALSVNGYFIHRIVIPSLRARVGRPLFSDLSPRRRTLLFLLGAISITSWYTPLLLGAIPQLNFVVPAWFILACYGLAVFAFVVVAETVARLLLGRHGAMVTAALKSKLQSAEDIRASYRFRLRPFAIAASVATCFLALGVLYFANPIGVRKSAMTAAFDRQSVALSEPVATAGAASEVERRLHNVVSLRDLQDTVVAPIAISS